MATPTELRGVFTSNVMGTLHNVLTIPLFVMCSRLWLFSTNISLIFLLKVLFYFSLQGVFTSNVMNLLLLLLEFYLFAYFAMKVFFIGNEAFR